MACIISDSRNTSYDGNLSTANGFYRVEASNLALTAGSTPALSSINIVPVTFANAGNCMGIMFEIYSATNNLCDRSIDVRLQEAKTVGSFDLTGETVNIATHGIADGTVVCFTSTGTLPTGINATTHYYVVNGTPDNFQVSLTSGGTRIALSGTPTGTATCWVTRATKTHTYDQVFGTFNESPAAARYWYCRGYVPFDFATPYAVDTTAGKWRFTVIQSGGTRGTWELITSNTTDIIYATWCDNKVSHQDDDTLIVKDLVMIDKTASVSGGLGTGATDYAICGVICRNTDYSKDNIALLKWKPAPVASYTFTIKGTFMMGTHSGFRIGTEAKPIPYAQLADVYFAEPAAGTITTSQIMTPSVSCPRGSVFIYGEVPTLTKTTLASDAAISQAHIITTDDTSAQWAADDYVAIGKQDVIGRGSLIVHQISSITGTDITLTANLATAKRIAGGSVIRFNGYGVRIRGYSNAIFGNIYVNTPSNFTVIGAEFIDARVTPAPGSYYYLLDDAAYRSKFLVQDCSARFTSTSMTGLINTPGPGKDGFLANRVNVFNGTVANNITGYANAVLQSAYYEESNCVVLNKYNAYNNPTVSTRTNYHDNKYENSYRHGFYLVGLGVILKNNYFWGHASANYGAVYVGQLINPVEISGNTYNKNYAAFLFGANVTVGAVDKNSIFGDEVANTYDVNLTAAALIDYEFNNPTGLNTVDTLYLPDTVPGSRLRLTDNGGVSNADINYLPDGYIIRTGEGLTDTTVHTSGAGKFALRFESLATVLTWSQKVPTGNVQNKDMVVSVWVKINNANYWAGGNQLPRLTITYDQTSVVYCQAAETTDWQKLFVSFTPLTTYGEITCKVDGYTDTTGSDAYFYVDDYSILYPAGYSLDLSGLDIWASGLPVTPTISTVTADAGSLLDALTANHQITGSVGKKISDLKNASYIVDGEIIL